MQHKAWLQVSVSRITFAPRDLGRKTKKIAANEKTRPGKRPNLREKLKGSFSARGEFYFVVHLRNGKISLWNVLTVKMCPLDRVQYAPNVSDRNLHNKPHTMHFTF